MTHLQQERDDVTVMSSAAGISAERLAGQEPAKRGAGCGLGTAPPPHLLPVTAEGQGSTSLAPPSRAAANTQSISAAGKTRFLTLRCPRAEALPFLGEE